MNEEYLKNKVMSRKKEEALYEFQIQLKKQELAYKQADQALDSVRSAKDEKELLRIIANQLILLNHKLSSNV